MSADRAITCPACGGSIAIKAAGYSVTLGCQYCGALLDVAHPDVALIARYEQAVAQLAIPLGRRGTLFGMEWEAIGALQRSDDELEWTEFLLFNPYAGYRWLVHSDGEWQFGTALLDRPEDEGDAQSVTWRGARFSRDYDLATCTTHQVIGEFYWRVKAGDSVVAASFSRDDETLSAEWSEGEINWTRLVPLSRRDVRDAFGLSRVRGAPPGGTSGRSDPPPADDDGNSATSAGLLGRLHGDYADAPGSGRSDLLNMFLLATGTLIASVLMMIGFGMTTQSVTNSLTIQVGGAEQTMTIGSLTINRPWQIITVSARSANFENRWIDLDYMLVNRATQRAYTAYGVVEHYAGRDSDGDWSEGSFSGETKFSSVPRGTYDVVVDATAHSWQASSFADPGNPWSSGEAIPINFKASAGGIMWGNIWLEMALLFGLPLLMLWWRSRQDD